jgi:hypothetical protein
VDVNAQQPLLFALFSGALGRDDLDDSFDWSFRQVYTDKQQPADARQSASEKRVPTSESPMPNLLIVSQ